jgi:hypothetical protein
MRKQKRQGPSAGGWGLRLPLTDQQGDEIRRALGATTIFALRQAFGAEFAHGAADDLMAGDALPFMDPQSRAMIIRNLRGQAGSGSV